MATITKRDGTKIEQSPEDVAKDKLEIQIQQCKQRGGRWDGTRCILPDTTPEKRPEPKPEDIRTRIERDEFGNIIRKTTEPLQPITKEERLEVGLAGISEVGAKEALAQKQKEGIKQAEKQAILDQPIERVELGATELGATTVPFIGGIARSFALQGFDLATDDTDTSLDPIRKQLGIMTTEEINELNISAIQKKELKKGLSASENVGSLIEGIPGAKWLNKWLDIETPRGNLEEVMQDIKAMKRPILKYGSDVRSGYMDKATATLKIDAAERYVISQEARLKLLILNSPSLEFNSDRVNGFETDILTVKEAIQQARIDAVDGKILDPTEREIYEQAQYQNTEEWRTSNW